MKVVITIDNKEFKIIGHIKYNDDLYVYMSGIDDEKDIRIAKLENRSITIVEDLNLFNELLEKFVNKANNEPY